MVLKVIFRWSFVRVLSDGNRMGIGGWFFRKILGLGSVR